MACQKFKVVVVNGTTAFINPETDLNNPLVLTALMRESNTNIYYKKNDICWWFEYKPNPHEYIKK